MASLLARNGIPSSGVFVIGSGLGVCQLTDTGNGGDIGSPWGECLCIDSEELDSTDEYLCVETENAEMGQAHGPV
jgi:hypothetical protein